MDKKARVVKSMGVILSASVSGELGMCPQILCPQIPDSQIQEDGWGWRWERGRGFGVRIIKVING